MPQFVRNRWFIVALAAILIGTPAFLLAGEKTTGDSPVVARVRKGEFRVTVTTSGELVASDFVRVMAPQNMQQAGQYQTKISTLVPEGTIVNVGDVVAELDRSGIATKLSDVTIALQKAEAVAEQAMLDSTLNLSKAREEIRGMELALEEKRLAKEQAVYEAPTVRRQAEIDLERADRALTQGRADYKTKVEQAQAKMREVGADVDRQRNLLKIVQEVMAGFTITASSPGMVIYVKEWNGKKRTSGSQVSSWEPTVATLPDLSKMESVTFVNEIDVRKVAVGQKAVITLDSDPSKALTGTVTSVANVGEQRPNTDAKVFEVKLVVEQSDTTLRPGMTTGNVIETYSVDSALFVPLDVLNSEQGIPVVFKQSGGRIVMQEVVTGAMNDDEVIIREGLGEDDRVLLSPPRDRTQLELVRLPGSTAGTETSRGDTSATGIQLKAGDSTRRARPAAAAPPRPR